ncbi:MAG: hypothetical protein H6757_01575 [Candidatus Omnitrophica bacterium]|nr:hypothetical protein [Candidatus Omnitrophota bacterium]
MILRKFRAERIYSEKDPALYAILSELCGADVCARIEIYRIPSLSPNVMTCGSLSGGYAAIGLTEGLLRNLNRAELKGVLAFALVFLEKKEGTVAAIAAILAGFIELKGESPVKGGVLISAMRTARQLAASFFIRAMRGSSKVVFEWDRKAASMSSNPLYLVSALQKMELGQKDYLLHEATLATAPLFMINPLLFRQKTDRRMFPYVEERMERLLNQARALGF